MEPVDGQWMWIVEWTTVSANVQNAGRAHFLLFFIFLCDSNINFSFCGRP